MNNLERATTYNTVDIIDYVTDKLVTERIISKTTGSVTMIALDAGINAGEKISAFDTLVQVIDGSADVTINGKRHPLTTGQCIVVPAHFRSHIVAKTRSKMLLTVIKSGYEDSI